MRILASITASAGLLALVAAAACSSSSDDNASTPTTDGGTTDSSSSVGDSATPPSDATTNTDSASDAATPQAFVRVAHLSPDAPPVKVCVTAAAASFSATDKPVAGPLSFKQVSYYLAVPPGAYKARLVAEGAADCATSLAGLPDYTLPALAADDYATAAAIGKVSALGSDASAAVAFTVKPFFDLLATPAMAQAHLRFVHAAPGTNIPVFVGAVASGNLSAALFSGVPFGDTDTALAATKGYKPIDVAGSKIELGAAATATGAVVWSTDALKASGLAEKSVQTAFAIDKGSDAGAGAIEVLVCDDTAKGTGANTTCAVLPPKT